MRIDIDVRLCIGSGLCVGPSGGAIALIETPEGPRAVPTGATGDPEGIAEAARRCPTLAIRLTDDSGRAVFPPVR